MLQHFPPSTKTSTVKLFIVYKWRRQQDADANDDDDDPFNSSFFSNIRLKLLKASVAGVLECL